MKPLTANKVFGGYIFIYAVYSLQGTLYPTGIINQLCQVMMIGIALVVGWPYLNPIGKEREPSRFLSVCRVILLMYIVYGIIALFGPTKMIHGNGHIVPQYVYLQSSLKSLLPIFMFAAFARKGVLTRKNMQILFYLLFVLSIFAMLRNQAEALMEHGTDAGEAQNNSGYLFVALMPLVLFFRRKIVQFGLMLLLLGFIVYCLKRGAILCGLICFLVFAYKTLQVTKSIKLKVGVGLLIIGAFLFEGFYIIKQYNENPFFQARIESTFEGNDSGRGELKHFIWKSFENKTTFLSLMVGNGANATIDAAGNYAHEDWLETFYNNGLIGVTILALFYLFMFAAILKVRKKISGDYQVMFLLVFISCFLPTFFSMSIQDMGLSKGLLLGLLIYISQKSSSISLSNSFNSTGPRIKF